MQHFKGKSKIKEAIQLAVVSENLLVYISDCNGKCTTWISPDKVMNLEEQPLNPTPSPAFIQEMYVILCRVWVDSAIKSSFVLGRDPFIMLSFDFTPEHDQTLAYILCFFATITSFFSYATSVIKRGRVQDYLTSWYIVCTGGVLFLKMNRKCMYLTWPMASLDIIFWI